MDPHTKSKNIRIILVGDGNVGKTSILQSYAGGKLSTEYVPTVFDNCTLQTVVDNHKVNLNLWDTTGQEPYKSIRTLSYAQADIHLIVFSVIDQTSLDNVVKKWYPELSSEDLSHIPKIIVGNKIDLRKEWNSEHIRYETATTQLKTLKCKYFECSTENTIELKQIFDEAIRMAMQNELKQQSQIDQLIIQEEKEQCYCNLF